MALAVQVDRHRAFDRVRRVPLAHSPQYGPCAVRWSRLARLSHLAQGRETQAMALGLDLAAWACLAIGTALGFSSERLRLLGRHFYVIAIVVFAAKIVFIDL